MMNKDQVEAFWSKVEMAEGIKSCWHWTGAKKPKGYGNVRINKKDKIAHRVAFELANGKIPDGYKVCHVCDNPPCCNPNHLMLGTTKSNSADMVLKGRQKSKIYASRGQQNGNSKLKENEVIEIRKKYRNHDANQYELADQYGVSQTLIGRIVRNKIWGHVNG